MNKSKIYMQESRKVYNNKRGFTLAEVLITIGTIGIIAAITIPGLIQNYQYKAWTAQLQKSYATLNQGFRRMLADENASLLSQTEAFQGITSCDYHNSYFDECKEFYKGLGKYFKIADIDVDPPANFDQYTYLNDNSKKNKYLPIISLMDGTVIFGSEFYSEDHISQNAMVKGLVGQFYIDINGLKRPNKIGRDIFWFYLGDNGIVYPRGSMAVSEYNCRNTTDCYWKTTDDMDYTCVLDGKSYGYGCAARVLETGNMEYPKVLSSGGYGSGSGSGS